MIQTKPPKDTIKIWHTENPKDITKNLVVLIKISEKKRYLKGTKQTYKNTFVYTSKSSLKEIKQPYLQ